MKEKIYFYTIVFALLLLFFLTYSNHFHNPFHFDDEHTIVSNEYIRKIKNIPLFFKDARTSSSLPANQDYRPVVTALNAIDYRLGGQKEPDSFYFHVSIFASYVILGIILYFFFLEIFNQSVYHKWNKYFALFGAAFFCLHTANAETINYIIARSDSFSTLMIVLSFVIYRYKTARRNKYAYLLPVIIGLFVKESVAVFAPLLFFYKLLVEEKLSFKNLFSFSPSASIKKILLATVPSLATGIIFYWIYEWMRPATWTSGGGAWYRYLFTQTFVIVHYINNFFLPLNLSADTDWTLIKTFHDDRVLAGTLVITALLILAFKTSLYRDTRPIAFGILWFFIALIPTSSIFSFAEALNDHRTFFPYIGLIIATVGSFRALIIKYEERFNSPLLKIATTSMASLVLLGHSYGTYQRNKVWSSEESLWYDVTVKSPLNARGLMNYGNSQMAKGNYAVAKDYFERALKLWPAYSYLYVNMGVLNGAMGKDDEADQNFTYAISINPANPECYYFYARWLKDQKKLVKAKEIALKGLAVSPGHVAIKNLTEELNKLEISGVNNSILLEEKTKQNPTPENYLNLSLTYYNENQYQKCIDAAEQALKIRPAYAEAYNNICSAYNVLKEWDKAIEAGEKGLAINPDNQLQKNNLAVSMQGKKDNLRK